MKTRALLSASRLRSASGWLRIVGGGVLALSLGHGRAAASPPTVPEGAKGSDVLGEVTLFGDKEISIEAATKTAIPLSRAPGAVSVITARQIRESGARTIPELLRLVPGANIRWNPMVQTIDVRSFGENPFSSRVLLLIDGVPYNAWDKGGFPQHPGFDFFVLQNVKRIEIVRGPGSALYGENAFWGVINIVTLSGEDLRGGRAELFGGDLETRTIGAMYGDKAGKDGSYLVSAKYTHSQFPTVFWAEENDSKVNGTDVFMKGRYKGFEASYFRHQDRVDGFSEPVELPGLPPGLAFSSVGEIRQTVQILAGKYRTKTADGHFSFDADVSWAHRKGAHCANCHAAPQRDFSTETYANHGYQALADLRLGIHSLPSQDLLVGVEGRHVDAGQHTDELLMHLPGETQMNPNTHYSKLAAYVQDQISLFRDKLGVTAGLRYDAKSHQFTEKFSPRIAAVYRASDALVLRGGWSTAFRFPNLSELYQDTWFFNVSAPGIAIPFAVFGPNPGLGPEKISSFDLGAEYRLRPEISLRADLFRSIVKDFIVIGVSSPPPPELPALSFINQPDQARITGAELEAKWNLKRGLTGFLNFSIQKEHQKDSLTDATGNRFEFVYSPEHKVNVGAYFGPFRGVHGSAEISWKDETTAPAFWGAVINGVPGEVTLPSYALANLRLIYDLPFDVGSLKRPFKLSAYGKNLFDKRVRETLVGADTRLVGRLFYGSVEASF